MRICMISVDFLPNSGGITTHICGLAKTLANDGHHVVVIKREQHRFKTKRERIGKIIVYRVSSGPNFLRSIWFPALVCAWSYVQFCIGRGLDIVHWHTPTLLDYKAANLCKSKVRVFTNHSSDFVKAASSGLETKLPKYIRTLKLADHVIVPSKELQTLTEQIGTPKCKIHYIPNGVDADYFKPLGYTRMPISIEGLDRSSTMVLSVRRLVEKNGLEYLIEAWPDVLRACPNAVLVLVGDGRCRQRLQDLANSLGLASSIFFLGTHPPADVVKFLNLADLVVLPSLIEATSISGLEAMSVGKALVGTNVGGIPEIIEQGYNGLLVPPARPDEMATAIISLVKDKSLRESMGKNGRARIEKNFTWQKIANRTLQVYKETLVN